MYIEIMSHPPTINEYAKQKGVAPETVRYWGKTGRIKVKMVKRPIDRLVSCVVEELSS